MNLELDSKFSVASKFFGRWPKPLLTIEAWWFRLPKITHSLVALFTLCVLVFVAYRPILPGNFVMDDYRLVTADNPLTKQELTLATIWFQVDFPLTTVAWWGEYQLWGENPAGYHLINILLHTLSAMLLWRLVLRLGIPGAWMAAAIFALHPICVNSVARIAELKNTLSLPFFLLSFLSYLHYESLALYPSPNLAAPKNRTRATFWYALALAAFLLSLLSKTTAVTLPPVILLCAYWQRSRIAPADLRHVAPFFLLALWFGLMSVWFQKHQALVGLTLEPAGWAERLAAAGQNFWFYLSKAISPIHLCVVYIRERINPAACASYFPLVAAVLTFGTCWHFRRRFGKPLLIGLGCYLVTLFPALGLIDAQYLTMWRVSDHLGYKPLIAALVLLSALLTSIPNKTLLRMVQCLTVLTLAVLTQQRAGLFASDESLLQDTLAKNPSAWAAHNDFGIMLAERKDFRGAVAHFETSLKYKPDNNGARVNLGRALTLLGRLPEAEIQFKEALQRDPADSAAHGDFANTLKQQGRLREALFHAQACLLLKPNLPKRQDYAELLFRTGDVPRAEAQFQLIIDAQPNHAEALNNLAWLLATSADPAWRDGPEAVCYAERACHVTTNRQTGMRGTLAAAYAEAGRFEEAQATAEAALNQAQANGEIQVASTLRQLLRYYRSGQPWHQSSL